jgi:DNA-directed RNA polymerase
LATPAQIEEQVKFEREAIKQGLERLRKNTKDLERQSYASATVYGCSSISALLPLVIERIEETKLRIKKGKTGAAFKEIHQYLEPIEPGAAAAIALKVTFDKVFSYRDKSNLLINVCEAIGTAVEQEAQMQFYERNCPGLLNTIQKNYWHNTTGTHQKFVIVKTLMSRYDVPQWSVWHRPNRIKLGTWLLDCVMEASGWFDKQYVYTGKRKDNYIVPTPAFMEIKDEVMANAELFSPIAYPMLIEPNDWTNERQGGYLLNEVMRGHDLVRRGGMYTGRNPIAFINKIQKVGYRLNDFVLGVAQHLDARGIAVGKFIPVVEIPLPPKPVDIAENYDSRKDYRRRAAEVMNENASAFKKSCRTRMTMEAARLFKDKDEFFIPWSFDYRGRAYPIPAFLTPQDTDFGKSLLKFSDEAFMTPEAEEWLAFQVATTYGLDKAPMHERMQWVQENDSIIAAVAEDPVHNLPIWEAAEEPWQFLAACDEYYHCVINCDRNYTSLPVATDATCSGLQILAGLCRDARTASLVNVLPADKPQDAYRVVAETAMPHVPECIQPYMDRKTVKRVVMTVPYNAKPHSNRQYIRDALKEKGLEEVDKDDLTQTVKAVRAAMDEVVPGPMAVMSWIEKEVGKAIKNGATELMWCTPSGFVVTQKLNKKLTETVKLQLLGRVQITVATEDSDKVDINHHKNATAPNLIHSLDASLLHLSALRFDAPISLIHDSVLCRATDMCSLSSIVRETYMHLFAESSYLENFAEQIGAETKPPIIGDLAPESVIESTYFFC